MTVEECLALHRTSRKNNVAIDVVSFGAVDENDKLIEVLLYGDGPIPEAFNPDEDNNHLVRIVQGQGSVVEGIAQSPVVRGDDAAGGAMDGAGFEFGVDPEMDPELAMALKLSMEEEMARQAKNNSNNKASDEDTQMEVDATPAGDEEDEDALLQQAIALSMQQQQSGDAPK